MVKNKMHDRVGCYNQRLSNYTESKIYIKNIIVIATHAYNNTQTKCEVINHVGWKCIDVTTLPS